MFVDRVLQEAEARQLPALIAEWSERSDALHWIARSLQLDLPLLIERPELVLPCLYRRCHWLGDTAFYQGRESVPAESESVVALIADWISARPMSWLRALRPPQFALDAGVVEEYRTALEGDIRFSADGALIGIIGKDGATVGWERVTGRKIDVRGRLEVPVVTWKHEWAEGRISLLSKDRRCDLAIADHEKVCGSYDLGDDLVLAESWWEPDPYDDLQEHVLYLVDAARQKILWRVESDPIRSMIRIGNSLQTLGDHITHRSLLTGVELARQPFPFSFSAMFAPSGTQLATRDEVVIRVWDLAQTPLRIPSCRVGGGTVSPDGTRLLSGTHLCDARTGAVIADLPMTGRGGWLEGGPPANAWVLVDNVVVQAMPWDVTVWDSTDGHELARFDLRSGVRGSVHHDPRGRYLALFLPPDRLSAHDLETGATLFETTANAIECGFRDYRIGFSDTGDELWWEAGGRGYAVPTTSWSPIREARIPEKPADRVDVIDGLLVVGSVAAPMDSKAATVSRDGRIFVGGDHYVLEGT